NENLFDTGRHDGVGDLFGDLAVPIDDRLGTLLARLGVDDRPCGVAPDDATLERVWLGGVLLCLCARDPGALLRTAIVGTSDDVLSHVDESAGQVAGVRGAQRGVSKTLPPA